jgi:hypothetical protein
MQTLRRFWNDESGATAIEYGLIYRRRGYHRDDHRRNQAVRHLRQCERHAEVASGGLAVGNQALSFGEDQPQCHVASLDIPSTSRSRSLVAT